MSLAVTEKPRYVIFLDIDDVLLEDYVKNHARATQESLDYIKRCAPDLEPYGSKWKSIVQAFVFSKDALGNLEELINKVSAVFIPQIVIHSGWREGRSVEQLRTIDFGMHLFAKYIIDKTRDRISKEKTGTKIDQIQCWLDENPDVKHFTILDDYGYDGDFKAKFKERFVHVREGVLSKTDVENALAADHLTTAR